MGNIYEMNINSRFISSENEFNLYSVFESDNFVYKEDLEEQYKTILGNLISFPTFNSAPSKAK